MMEDYRDIIKEWRQRPNEKYGGYHLADRPAADPELTETGPRTPAGEYWRRFWFPICLSEEVTNRPLRKRILSEDLVVYRDGEGNVGLLHLHCSHRNMSLEFGIIEDRGIRCAYHGWLYDYDGTVMETPGEPAGSPLCEKVKQGAYPVQEFKGLVFAYMGPMSEIPDFPIYDTFDLDGHELVPYRLSYPCNYLQVAENTMDPIHTVYLHTLVGETQFEETWGITPVLKFHDGETGLYSTLTYRVDDMIWVRTQQTVFPTFSHVGAFWETGKDEKYFKRSSITKWTVPIDDTNSMIIAWRHFGPAIDPDGKGKRDEVKIESVDFEGQTEARDYDEMQRNPGDYEAQVSIGPVARHAAENLGKTDQGVMMLRNRLRRGIRDVANGKRVLHYDAGKPTKNLYTQDTVMPIPKRDDMDDDELMAAVAEEVMRVVREGDNYAGMERETFIIENLKKIKSDKRFVVG